MSAARAELFMIAKSPSRLFSFRRETDRSTECKNSTRVMFNTEKSIHNLTNVPTIEEWFLGRWFNIEHNTVSFKTKIVKIITYKKKIIYMTCQATEERLRAQRDCLSYLCNMSIDIFKKTFIRLSRTSFI